METLFKSYPVFEDSQVLTSSQLNQLTNYLDQQTRLTRVKLIGIGIACGLEVDHSTNAATGTSELIISGGVGITSHGFQINIGSCTTKHYREYTLPESGNDGAGYAPFIKGDGAQVQLYELLTDAGKLKAEEEDPDEIITTLDTGFLTNKVVLLFVECFDRDLKSCLGKACDDLGIDRILTVRKLVVSIDDLNTTILHANDTLGGGLFTDKFDLPSTAMPRVLFDPLLDHSSKYLDFSLNYKNNLTDVFNELFVDTSGTGISGILSQSYVVFEPVLNSVSTSNPFESNTVTTLKALWLDYLNDTLGTGTTAHFGIQYFYDFLKDLILAYNEFKGVAFELMSECCPNTSLFPKHLMLGEAIPVDNCEPSIYRHGFNQATIYNNQKYLLEKATSLHKKIVLMLLNFNLDKINNPVGAAGPPLIKITPSSEKQTDLSVRSIPFFYDVDVPQTGDFSNLGTLEDSWNFDILRTCPDFGDQTLAIAEVGVKDPTAIKSIAKAGMAHGADNVILSYHNNNINDTVPLNPTQTPLLYDLDPYSFFRVEAIQGRTVVDVENKLAELNSKFDLPFKVLNLRLHDKENLDFFKTECNFDDLRTSYAICREEFKCFIDSICNRLVNFPDASREFGSGVNGDSVTETDNRVKDLGTLYEDKIVDFCLKIGTFFGTANPLVPFALEDFDYGFTTVPSIKRIADEFAVESSTIPDASQAKLSMVAAELNNNPKLTLLLVGYSDGTETDALKLSFERAQAVREVCIEKGASPTRVAILGKGATDFVDPDIPTAGANRRVEMIMVETVDVINPTGFIETYLAAIQDAIDIKVILQDYIDALIRNTRTKHPKELYFTYSFFLSEILRHIDNFIISCHYEKFEVIYYTLLYRINYLQENDLGILSNFIKKHPGIDHKAGVQPGGSLIIVHEGLGTGEDEVFADFSLPYLSACDCECLEIPPPALTSNVCEEQIQPFPVGLTVQGEGFFPIMIEATGEILYTERATAHLNNSGEIVDENDNRFEPSTALPLEYESVTFAANGEISVLVGPDVVIQGAMQIATFSNPAGLEDKGQGYFAETADSGVATFGNPGDIGFGTLVETQLATPLRIEENNRELDVVHGGRGRFMVQLTDGSIAYTGSYAPMELDINGNIMIHGHPMEPAMSIPPGAVNIVIAGDGQLSYDENGVTTVAGSIPTALFFNPLGFIESEPGIFMETAASGSPSIGNPGSAGRGELRQGFGLCVTAESELNLPVFAPPQLAVYQLGDYAFGKNCDANYGTENAPNSFVDIDVLPKIQYDRGDFPDETWIKLCLVNSGGAATAAVAAQFFRVDSHLAEMKKLEGRSAVLVSAAEQLKVTAEAETAMTAAVANARTLAKVEATLLGVEAQTLTERAIEVAKVALIQAIELAMTLVSAAYQTDVKARLLSSEIDAVALAKLTNAMTAATTAEAKLRLASSSFKQLAPASTATGADISADMLVADIAMKEAREAVEIASQEVVKSEEVILSYIEVASIEKYSQAVKLVEITEKAVKVSAKILDTVELCKDCSSVSLAAADAMMATKVTEAAAIDAESAATLQEVVVFASAVKMAADNADLKIQAAMVAAVAIDATSTVQKGSVQVITTEKQTEEFRYFAPADLLGVDCFFYFFKIVDPSTGITLKTSTCAKVTVHVVEEDTQHIELESNTLMM